MKTNTERQPAGHRITVIILLFLLLTVSAIFPHPSFAESETQKVRVGYYENEVF